MYQYARVRYLIVVKFTVYMLVICNVYSAQDIVCERKSFGHGFEPRRGFFKQSLTCSDECWKLAHVAQLVERKTFTTSIFFCRSPLMFCVKPTFLFVTSIYFIICTVVVTCIIFYVLFLETIDEK